MLYLVIFVVVVYLTFYDQPFIKSATCIKLTPTFY